MSATVLYHVTKQKNVREILEKGLLPKIGKNAELAGDTLPQIYLCNKRDVPLWTILTGSDTVLAINVRKMDENLIRVGYSNYGETRCDSSIDSSRIRVIEPCTKEQLEKANEKAALNYTWVISEYCQEFLDLELTLRSKNLCICERKERIKELKTDTDVMLKILSHIDMKRVDPKKYIRELKRQSNDYCAYSFADYYMQDRKDRNGVPRCFEHLVDLEYGLAGIAKPFYEFIRDNYPEEAKYVKDVGGYSK